MIKKVNSSIYYIENYIQMQKLTSILKNSLWQWSTKLLDRKNQDIPYD